MNSILFFVNAAFAFTRQLKDLETVLGYKYPAAQHLFMMFSKIPQMVLQEITVPAGMSETQIIEKWVEDMVVTRVIYHADYGGFNISEAAYQWLFQNNNVQLDYFERTMFLTDLPRHHPRLIECFHVFGEDFGNAMQCAVILGTKYKILDYDGFEQVRSPYMDKWIDSTEPLKPFDAYI
jgi:hypothetical protein